LDAPVRIIAFVWWPIVIYLGWIVVATVTNIAAFLVSINFDSGFISASTWTIVLITAAVFIYLFLVLYRNMREAAMVGVWALIAIAVRQWQVHEGIVIAALAGAGILLAVVSRHGFKSVETNLDKYLISKALDGLFLKIGTGEKRIRENPEARVTDLLKRVFGSVDD